MRRQERPPGGPCTAPRRERPRRSPDCLLPGRRMDRKRERAKNTPEPAGFPHPHGLGIACGPGFAGARAHALSGMPARFLAPRGQPKADRNAANSDLAATSPLSVSIRPGENISPGLAFGPDRGRSGSSPQSERLIWLGESFRTPPLLTSLRILPCSSPAGRATAFVYSALGIGTMTNRLNSGHRRPSFQIFACENGRAPDHPKDSCFHARIPR